MNRFSRTLVLLVVGLTSCVATPDDESGEHEDLNWSDDGSDPQKAPLSSSCSVSGCSGVASSCSITCDMGKPKCECGKDNSASCTCGP